MNLFTEIQLQRAVSLLDSLNEDLKPKEQYQSVGIFTEKGLNVYICANSEKDILFNVLDYDGNFPKDFSACWRTFEHIKQDLKLCPTAE